MAEGDASVFNQFKESLLKGDCDLVNDTIKVVLLNSLYSHTIDGNLGLAAVDSHEITATGYNAGGCTLASKTVTQVDTQDNAEFDGADITWASLGTDVIRSAVMYDDTVTATYGGGVADPLMIRWEIATNSNGGNYTLQFGSSGILELG